MIEVIIRPFEGPNGLKYEKIKLPNRSRIYDFKSKIHAKNGIPIVQICLIENSKTKILDDDFELEDAMVFHLTLPFRCYSCPGMVEYFSPVLV